MELLIPVLVVAVLGIPLIGISTFRLPADQRRFIQRVLVGALLARVALSVLFETVPAVRIFHEDTAGYEYFGARLASYWMGEGPPYLSPERNYGFYYVVGAFEYLFGRYRLNASIVNCLIGTFNVMIIFRIGLHLFHQAIARRTAVLSAFFPSMVVWSSMALKDAFITCMVCVCLLFCIRLRRQMSIFNVLGMMAPIVAIYPIRFYLVYFLLASVMGTMALARPGRIVAGISKQVLLGVGLAVVVVGFGLSSSASGDLEMLNLEAVSNYRQGMAISANSGFSQNVDLSTPGAAILFLPVGATAMLWAPFPWQMVSLRPLLTLPEMLMWWWFIPALLRGFWYAARKRFTDYSPIIVFTATLVIGYSISLGNVGAAFRMRAQVLNLLFLFVALGQYMKVARRKGIDLGVLLNESRLPVSTARPGKAVA